MFAVTILGVVVLAVFAAVSATQKVSFEGQKRLLAAMAADDLMIEFTTLTYNELRGKNGMTQAVGEMQSLDGTPYPNTFWAIGRNVSVTETMIKAQDVNVRGLQIVVTTVDQSADLVRLEMFVPEGSVP